MDMHFPSFKSFVQAEVVSPNQVILFNENQSCQLLEGETYALLAPYLSKGTYSIDQIIHRLEKKISTPEIYYALFRLKENGLLEESSSKLPKSIQALCNLLNVSLKDAEERISKTSVSIYSFGNVSIKPFVSALKSLSLKVSDTGNFSIVVTDNYRHPKIRELFLKSMTPYLLIKPTSSKVWIGPLLIPERTACLDCLLDSLNKSTQQEQIVEQQLQKTIPVTINKATLQTTTSLAYNLAANEIFKWIVQNANPNLESTILSYQFLNGSVLSQRILKNTNCHCKVASSTENQNKENPLRFPAKNEERIPTSKVSENPSQSLLNLDLQYIIPRMVEKKGWSREDAQDIVRKYKNFLALRILYPTLNCVPTLEIDEIWHDHILHTQQYMRDCEQIFGGYLHHLPSDGSDENKGSLATYFQETKDLYEKHFQEAYTYDLL
ncbi:MAG TPA: TOMM precursor leader peptide-binding protein [Chlamydiales bacterium]|nr:TOMM precursor leader peptide-binding protein [Chlamydiales bacterium]